MRVYGPTGLRSYPTDRNPSTVAVSGNFSVTNSGVSTVMTYTVPAGRRADLTAFVNGVVTTVLIAGQQGFVEIDVNAGAGLKAADASRTAAAAPAGTVVRGGQVHVQLKAGDVVSSVVSVGAGGGVMDGTAGVTGVEYDA